MKNFFKSKKPNPQPKVPEQPVPRTMDELNTLYTELCNRAGQLQYQVETNKEQLDNINTAIRNINYEADARRKLDAEAETKKTEESKQSDAGVTTNV